MAARELLNKLGEAAVKWQRTSAGVWNKPLISAKNLARLRRETLVAGDEWPYEKPVVEVKRRKPKGHKHDREKPQRQAEIAKQLESADKRIAEYRASRQAPLKEASLLDRIMLSPKQIREKAKAG